MTREELIAKARTAKSPEELLKTAHDSGVSDFSEANAKEYFDLLHKSGELSDSELDSAVGGCATRNSSGKLVVTPGNLCRKRNTGEPQWICKKCGNPSKTCRCLKDPSSFENKLGYAFTTNVKETCETCRYYMHSPTIGRSSYCDNPRL